MDQEKENREIRKSKPIKVSIVIPVYNAEACLRECLNSVLHQTLRETEILCVDDGSTDRSPSILSEYAARDDRLRILRQDNAGPGAARNRGLAEAAGEYVIFLDADDWFECDLLSSLTAAADRQQADVTICRAERFDDRSGAPLPSQWMLKEEILPGEGFSPEEIADHLFQFTFGQVWDKLFSRAFLKKSGILFPRLRCAEDTAFAYRTLLSAARIAVVPEVKLHYRVNRSGSVSNSIRREPEAPYESFAQIRAHLEGLENKALYERSFLNWAMEYLIWHLNNMPDPGIRRRYWRELKSRWFPELGFDAHPADYWQSRQIYGRYLLVRRLPYPVYALILGVYKRLKPTRLMHGHE